MQYTIHFTTDQIISVVKCIKISIDSARNSNLGRAHPKGNKFKKRMLIINLMLSKYVKPA